MQVRVITRKGPDRPQHDAEGRTVQEVAVAQFGDGAKANPFVSPHTAPGVHVYVVHRGGSEVGRVIVPKASDDEPIPAADFDPAALAAPKPKARARKTAANPFFPDVTE